MHCNRHTDQRPATLNRRRPAGNAYRVAAAIAATLALGCASGGTGTGTCVPEYRWNDSLRPARIMVIGDLQPTLLPERRFLGREQNDSVRLRMVKAALGSRPEMLLLLGDLVGDGGSADDWSAFDTLFHPLRADGVPIFSVVGNHDYGLLTNRGLDRFRRRFPDYNPMPTVVRLADSVVLIPFDSNLDRLPASLRKAQRARFAELLARLDNDPAIKGVVVACHHPPYTNSALGVDPELRRSFAEPFCASRKTLLFLSGHVHSYERIEVGDKMFVVTGGGGGPRRAVDTSANRTWPNDHWNHGTIRPFNYVELRAEPQGLVCTAMMLVGDRFVAGDNWTVDWVR